MDLEDLRLIQANERRSKGLQMLERSFYEKIGAYISALEDKRRDTDDSNVMMADNELRNAKSVVDDIFKRRIGKIIKMATTKAFGLDIRPEGATSEELELFEQLVDLVKKGKSRMDSAVFSKAKNMESMGENNATESSLLHDRMKLQTNRKNIGKDFTIVRILKDIPVFMGADGYNYKLSGQDVAALPKINAKALCGRNVAEDITME
ncbi:MAG: hypothetical protein BME93_01835 [Methanosarcinales archaeon Met12]|nr:MAG: hypothetical protein BME93_01835 [Methanosarcinales archaeon Met12]